MARCRTNNFIFNQHRWNDKRLLIWVIRQQSTQVQPIGLRKTIWRVTCAGEIRKRSESNGIGNNADHLTSVSQIAWYGSSRYRNSFTVWKARETVLCDGSKVRNLSDRDRSNDCLSDLSLVFLKECESDGLRETALISYYLNLVRQRICSPEFSKIWKRKRVKPMGQETVTVGFEAENCIWRLPV